MYNTAHAEKVAKIQEQMRSLRSFPISLNYRANHSNTTRSRSYKKGCERLDLGELDAIIQIDSEKRIAIVEPRVTMEQLVKATLIHDLIPPIVPEFKNITVGGAVMGGAGESGSHLWGSFNDICLSLEILCGDGTVIKATPNENEDIFYGFPCSYGSLGVLLSAAIKLIPAKESVRLKYHQCSSAGEGIQKLKELVQASSDFLDGIVFSKNSIIIIEGHLENANHLPQFSTKPLSSPWYYQHVEKLQTNEETMPLYDYLFRYDQGAFWVGGFLLRPQLLLRYLVQGILKLSKFNPNYTEAEIKKLSSPPRPNIFWRTLLHPILTTKNLWRLFHLADKWNQRHAILQDFCIPEENAVKFLEEVMEDPGTFPLWLCPIKSSHQAQIFAPHYTSTNYVINVGIYGLPSYYVSSIEEVTKNLENRVRNSEGKKVLYSRSFYTEEEFWQIYSREAYRALRTKMRAEGVFHEITEKVLSE